MLDCKTGYGIIVLAWFRLHGGMVGEKGISGKTVFIITSEKGLVGHSQIDRVKFEEKHKNRKTGI